MPLPMALPTPTTPSITPPPLLMSFVGTNWVGGLRLRLWFDREHGVSTRVDELLKPRAICERRRDSLAMHGNRSARESDRLVATVNGDGAWICDFDGKFWVEGLSVRRNAIGNGDHFRIKRRFLAFALSRRRRVGARSRAAAATLAVRRNVEALLRVRHGFVLLFLFVQSLFSPAD